MEGDGGGFGGGRGAESGRFGCKKQGYGMFFAKSCLKIWSIEKKAVPLQPNYRASPIRPAPSELPQALTGARVGGCSGAM